MRSIQVIMHARNVMQASAFLMSRRLLFQQDHGLSVRGASQVRAHNFLLPCQAEGMLTVYADIAFVSSASSSLRKFPLEAVFPQMNARHRKP